PAHARRDGLVVAARARADRQAQGRRGPRTQGARNRPARSRASGREAGSRYRAKPVRMMGALPRRRTLPAGRSAGALLVMLGAALVGTMPVVLAPAVAHAAPEDPRAEAKREVERAEVQYKLGR